MKGGPEYFLSEDLKVFQGGRFSHATFGKKMNMIAGTEVINGDKKVILDFDHFSFQ